MSLDWNAKEAPGWKDLDDSAKEAAIFATMFVGIGKVDAEHLPEYIARVLLMDKLGQGSYLMAGPNGEPVSAWTVEKLLLVEGLRSNVTYEPRDKWLARITGRTLDDTVHAAKKAYEAKHGKPWPAPPEPTDLAKKLHATFNAWRIGEIVERYAKELAREAGVPDVGHLDLYVGDEVHDEARAMGPKIIDAIVTAVNERNQEG